MARGKRSVRPEFISGLVVVCLIVFTLIVDWWEEHAVIGWTILGILIAIFIFLLYRFARFRGWIVRKGISAGKKIVYEDSVQNREPIPRYLYGKVMRRASYHCQNPDCGYRGRPQVHHINQDNSDNRFWNLIALCPNCHTDTHRGKFTHSQLRNFLKYSAGRQKEKTPRPPSLPTPTFIFPNPPAQ